MYKEFLTAKYEDVQGITLIDSQKSGPNIAIFAITHGNEVAGLQVFDFLVNEFQIQDKLKQGKIYLICINLVAHKKDKRLQDHNMNRIYRPEIKSGYEYERIKQLEKIFDEIDIVLDLHSMPKGGESILITDKNLKDEAKKIFQADMILIDDMSKSSAIISYFISKGKPAFGLECGNHNDKTAYKVGVQNTLNLLAYCGLIKGEIQNKQDLPVYEFLEEIIPVSKEFHRTKDYKNFGEIAKGEVYAQDGEMEHVNNYSHTVYIGLGGGPLIVGDGQGFLFKKIE